jgi:hypothetical protein
MTVELRDAYRNLTVVDNAGSSLGTFTAQTVDANFQLKAGYGITLQVDPDTNKVTIVNTGPGAGALTTVLDINANGTYYPIFTRAPSPSDINPFTLTYQMDTMYLDQTTTPMTYNPSTSTLAVSNISAPTITGHPTIEGVTSTGATGTGKFVFDGSPTLVTPVLGSATATSINKMSITAPATSSTLAVADGKTFTVNNTITLSGTDSTTITLPATTGTVALNNQQFYLGTTQIAINRTTASQTLNGVSIDGNAVTATTATKSTNIIGGNSTTLLGSIPYQSDTDTTTLLGPNTTTTRKFLKQSGNGTNGAAPAWDTLVAGDIPSTLNSVTINGTLTINGTTTTVNTNIMTVDDKNIEIGSVASSTVSTTGTVGSITGSGPWTATITNMSSTVGLIVGSSISATAGTGTLYGGSPTSVLVTSIIDATSITYQVTGGTTPTAGTVTSITTTGASDDTANGGGITLKGASDKLITWNKTSTAWTSSENLDIGSGKTYKINSTDVLTNSIVLGSATGITVGGTSTTTIGLGTNTVGSNTVTIGGAVDGNILKIAGTTGGITSAITTDVTTGTVSVFNTGLTGTLYIGNAVTGTFALANAATTIQMGNIVTGAQTVNMFTASTGASTYNIATGPTLASTTKTINIGTAGVSTSVTNVNIGSSVSGATGTITLSGTTGALVNSATTISLGNTATAAQTVNMFTASTAASTYNIATGATTNAIVKTINIATGAAAAGSNTITATAAGTGITLGSAATYAQGTPITTSASLSATTSGGLLPSTTYYVAAAISSSTTVTLAATVGGSAITFTASTISANNTVTVGSLSQVNIGPSVAGSTANVTVNGNLIVNPLVSGTATINGTLVIQQSIEVLNTKTGATGTVTHDFSTGAIFYHTSPAANFTANITNVPTTDNRSITVTLVIVQGASAYIPTVLQINSSAVTIKWAGGNAPTGTPNQTDVVSFVLMRISSTWVAFAGLSNFN